MSNLQIKQPKYEDREAIKGVVRRTMNRKRSTLSSYSDFVIDGDLLHEISCGNEKLVKETQEFIAEHQKEDAAFGGFLAIGVFRVIKKNISSNDNSDWIHLVFDHGHGVTLIAGRIGHSDRTFKNFMDRSHLFSMANMLKNG